MCIRDSSWVLLGHSWALLDAPALLGHSWALLGHSWIAIAGARQCAPKRAKVGPRHVAYRALTQHPGWTGNTRTLRAQVAIGSARARSAGRAKLFTEIRAPRAQRPARATHARKTSAQLSCFRKYARLAREGRHALRNQTFAPSEAPLRNLGRLSEGRYIYIYIY